MAAKSLLLLSISLFLAQAWVADMSIISYDEEKLNAMYESWTVKHGKSYNALGEKRFQIFKENLRHIEEQNAVEGRPYKLGLNRFADLTNQEYRRMHLGTKRRSALRLGATKSDRYALREGDSLPESVDWRTKGAVTPVKDQGSCAQSYEKPPNRSTDLKAMIQMISGSSAKPLLRRLSQKRRCWLLREKMLRSQFLNDDRRLVARRSSKLPAS